MAKTRARSWCSTTIAQVGLKRFPAETLRGGQGVDATRRDPGALAGHARRWRSPIACGRSGAPAPASTTSRCAAMSQARRAGVQRAGRERQRGEGAGARRHADRGAQPRAGAASSSARCAATTPPCRRRSRTARSSFAGVELPGHTLGVIGLGKIGSLVADAAIRLGMNVLGYDPEITVDAAWSLPSQVRKRATSIEEVLQGEPLRHAARAARCETTRHLVNAKQRRAAASRRGAAQLLARGRRRRRGGASRRSTRSALKCLRVRFPGGRAAGHAGVIALPHLGASTARGGGQLRGHGGRPAARLPRARQRAERGQLSRRGRWRARRRTASRSPTPTCRTCSGRSRTAMAQAGLNIHNMLNKSKGEMAYTLVDVDSPVPAEAIDTHPADRRRARGALSASIRAWLTGLRTDGRRMTTRPRDRAPAREIDRSTARSSRLIGERARSRSAIGALKGDGPAYRPEREAQVLRRVAAANRGPLPAESVSAVFGEIMSACRALEAAARVAYLGPQGTFSEEAVAQALRRRGRRRCRAPRSTRCSAQVETGAAQFGVVPVENSTEGAVGRTLDLLLATPLRICGEVDAARPAEPDGEGRARSPAVKRVYSHAQSLAQCQQLARAQPAAGRARAGGRATPRRRAAPPAKPEAAAIGPAIAAERYGLAIARAQHRGRAEQHHALPRARRRRRRRRPGATAPRSCCRRATARARCTRCSRRSPTHGVSMTRLESRPARVGRCGSTCSSSTSKGTSRTPSVAAALAELKRHRAVPQGARLLPGRDAMTSRDERHACMRSLRARRPRTSARSRRTSRASRSPSSRARWGSTRRGIIKLASNENPLGVGPRARAAIEAALARARALSRRQRLRAEAGARRALRRRRWTAIVLGNGSNDVLELVGARVPRAGARGGLLAARVRGLSARHAGARRARDRGAGEELRPRPRGDGGGDRRRDARRLHRQPEQSDRHASSRRGELEAFLARVPRAACWWCSTRPTTSTCRPTLRCDSVALAQAPSEPGRHAHLLQGLRPRRAARRLRARAPVGRRPHEPRAPAVQRQQPRARRGDRGARRHGVRRAQLRS